MTSWLYQDRNRDEKICQTSDPVDVGIFFPCDQQWLWGAPNLIIQDSVNSRDSLVRQDSNVRSLELIPELSECGEPRPGVMNGKTRTSSLFKTAYPFSSFCCDMIAPMARPDAFVSTTNFLWWIRNHQCVLSDKSYDNCTKIRS